MTERADLADAYNTLVTVGLVTAAVLLVMGGVAGRLLARRGDSGPVLGTVVVPVLFVVAAAAVGGTSLGVAWISSGYPSL